VRQSRAPKNSGKAEHASSEATTEDDASEDDDADFSAEAQIDIANRLVWRGIAFSHHALWEPSASILLYGFTAEYWSAYTLTNELSGRHLAAVVPSLSYEAAFEHVYLKPGVIYYAVSPDGLQPTLEGTLEGAEEALGDERGGTLPGAVDVVGEGGSGWRGRGRFRGGRREGLGGRLPVGRELAGVALRVVVPGDVARRRPAHDLRSCGESLNAQTPNVTASSRAAVHSPWL